MKYLTDEERQALFAQIRDPRDRAIFTLAFWRGLRASEVGGLKLEDWRAKIGRLYVRRLKGSISQDYKLTQEEERALKAWLRVRGKVSGPLFTGYRGRGLGRRQLDRLIKRYSRLAGIPEEKRHFHVLKHGCATFLVDQDIPIRMVQDHLGHADIRSTLVYADVTPRKREELARKIGGLRAG